MRLAAAGDGEAKRARIRCAVDLGIERAAQDRVRPAEPSFQTVDMHQVAGIQGWRVGES